MSWLSSLMRQLLKKPSAPAPEPSQPPRATIAVHVRDLSGAPVVGATFRLNEDIRTTTNADGYAAIETFKGEVFYAVEQEGYHAVHSSLQLEQNSQLPIWLEAQLPALPGKCRQLRGQLRAVGAGYADDQGPVLPVFCHAGDLFSLFTRDKDRAKAELLKVRNAGYHGLRVWTVLTGAYWEGPDRHVRPTTTYDYWGQWIAFVAAVRDLGLTLVVSQGDLWQLRDVINVEDFARKLASVEALYPGTYAFFDAGNETWQNGMSDERELQKFVTAYKNAGGKAICTLTSPQDEEPEGLRRYRADVWDKHGFRGGRLWDKRRHAFSVGYEGMPKTLGIESEPPGPGALVSVMEYKDEMTDGGCALVAAANVLARAAFVYFNGDGVRIQRGLDTEPGFFSVPKVVAALPQSAMDHAVWTLHHSGETWRRLRLFDSGVTHEVRVDGVQSTAGDFAYTIDGPPGTHTFRVARPFVAQTVHTVTGSVSAPFRCEAGQSMTFQWTAQEGGVVLVGRLR